MVVPAHNEQALLPRCLAGLDRAGRSAGLALTVVVVLDGCTDDSRLVVETVSRSVACRVIAVVCDTRCVGAARRIGIQRLLEVLGDGEIWIATTDADSCVPANWLVRQGVYLGAGAELVAGTVRVRDWDGRSHLRSPWEASYRTPATHHGHVHGANLGFLASTYAAVGGFADVTHDEDLTLVQRAIGRGVSLVWAEDLPVETSGRSVGRAPHGFSSFLDRLSVPWTTQLSTQPK